MKKLYNKIKVFNNEAKTITNNSGVYGVLDKNNQKIYIGSSNHVKRRYYEHASYLRNNKHWIEELQERWNLLGKDNFEFVVLEECLDYEDKEQFYLSNNLDKRYNKSEYIDSTGLKHSLETKEKLRVARSKYSIPPEAYKKAQKTLLSKNPNFYSEIGKLGQKKIKESNIKRNMDSYKTNEFRDKISKISKERNRNKPPTIICNETKETFATCGEAAERLGLKSYKVIWKIINGESKSYNGLTFSKI